MAKIVVLGSGGWGTALAVTAFRNGHEVWLWSKFPQEIEEIKKHGENKKLLPGVAIPEEIRLTSDLSCINAAGLIVMAVPSFAVRQTAGLLKPFLTAGATVVNVSKGLEEGSLKRLSAVIQEELPEAKVAVLSGPSHAEEVSRGIPTTVVAAAAEMPVAEYVQELFASGTFRIYTNSDIAGVELGGALKNVIALCAGVCDGLGLGDNTKAALMTRGITEIARLGEALGARSETFGGLSGIGDLIVTCTSMHSRNRRAGILIGEGKTAAQAIQEIGMTVEGYHAAKTAKELADKTGVEMPIVEQCYAVLYQDLSAKQAISNLMSRPYKHEMEQIWIQNK